VARSTNGGANWSLLTCDTATSSYGYRVRVDPTDTSVIYCAGFRSGKNSFVYRSTDHGDNWTAIDMGVPGQARMVSTSAAQPSTHRGRLYTSGM